MSLPLSRCRRRCARLALASAVLLFAASLPAVAATHPSPAPTTSAEPIAVPSGGALVLVPAGTEVPCRLVAAVDSGSAKAGETFAIETTADVVAGGFVVVPKGASGQGTIVQSDAAGGNGHSGSLQYRFDYVVSADGGKIKLAPDVQTKAEDDRKGAKSTATLIGVATLGIGGLFGHNLARGRQSTIDDKTPLKAFTAGDVHVVATRHAAPERYDQ